MRFLLAVLLLPVMTHGSGVTPSMGKVIMNLGGIAVKGDIAYELVRGNHRKLLEFFIEHEIIAPDFSVEVDESRRGSLLLMAVKARNPSLIEEIVSLKGKEGIAEIDFALRSVARYDSTTAMEQGEEAFADFEATQLTMMELLIEGGANVNSKEDWKTPLTEAILSYRAPRVKLLLERGAVDGDIDNALLIVERLYSPDFLKRYRWRGEFEKGLIEIKKLLADHGLQSVSSKRWQGRHQLQDDFTTLRKL